ncbi:hypothetical protein N9O57_01315 [bacterium]|nr:hypothetical protein [bacterium]
MEKARLITNGHYQITTAQVVKLCAQAKTGTGPVVCLTEALKKFDSNYNNIHISTDNAITLCQRR